MAWRPHSRARVDPQSPRAFGVCDRCGFTYNLAADLKWQHDFRGPVLANTWLRVCYTCIDVPQAQLKPKIVSADPTPVWQPRPENLMAEEGPQPPPFDPAHPNGLPPQPEPAGPPPPPPTPWPPGSK